jgi:hypothetical protein
MVHEEAGAKGANVSDAATPSREALEATKAELEIKKLEAEVASLRMEAEARRRRAQKFQSFVALAIFVTICATLWAVYQRAAAVPNELPRSWSLGEIARQSPPYGTGGRVYVLAWKVMEDDRPLRVESCLVLKVLDADDGHGRWCLAHLYRRPLEKEPEWQLSMTHVSGAPGTKYFPGLMIHHSKRFVERPGNKELYASLSVEDVGWTFEQEDGWKFVSCGVCEANWQAAVGEAPTRFFGK